jgi:hypothetical protein
MTQHAPEESSRVAKRIPCEDRKPVSTPDPGEGYRIVTDYSEAPHPDAEYWCTDQLQWSERVGSQFPYAKQFVYRVPIDHAPGPPIPLTEDPLPWFSEPDRSASVIVWIVAALVFATGFWLGWSL